MSWFDQCGRPVDMDSKLEALHFLVNDWGCDLQESKMVLAVVCREIEHDQPARAQSYLRHFVPRPNSEVGVMRTLAILTSRIEKTMTEEIIGKLLATRKKLQGL